MPEANLRFLELPPRYTAYETARYAVLPIPYDATTTYQTGARRAPAAILEASQHLENFDEETGKEHHKAGIATLEPVEPEAAGPQAMHEKLYSIARTVVKDGKFLLGLGGEHGISSALVRAVMGRYRKLSVLQIDAHSDLRDDYQGTPYSHACVMRRILDLGATIVPVGIRCISLEENRFMKRAKIRPITARECHHDEGWIDRALEGLTDNVYVTIDVDGIDPAYAPGTGTPIPGGLDYFQVTDLLRRVATERTVVAGDIVEVCPIPGQVVTESLAARLAYKLICYTQL